MCAVKTNHKAGDLRDCFIITPIGSIGSDTFRKADGLIKSVLAPILGLFNFKAVASYQIDQSGSITKQIITHIYEDELVIANLTTLNPNVMYELAIRHSFKKKVIIIAEHDTKLPFDVTDQRTIFYEDSFWGSEDLKIRLEKSIKDTLESDDISNPINDALREAAILESMKDVDSNKYIIDRLDRIERNLTNSTNTQQPVGIWTGELDDNRIIRFKDTYDAPMSSVKHSMGNLASTYKIVDFELRKIKDYYEIKFSPVVPHENIRSFRNALREGYIILV